MEIIKSQLKKINPFWLITLSIVFGLTLPVLFQDGMFQDAVLYSCVSHNLSIGIGTFWFPQYSTLNLEGIPSFHEQPPLVFGIQSLFYMLLGESLYVERYYTFLMIVFNAILINVLWKVVLKNKIEYIQYGWLPIFLWIIIPVCFWSYRGNIIENTVSIFTLSSIIISFKIIQLQKKDFLYWICPGFFIFLASFSKGVPGFFPITFPFFYWLITKKVSFKDCILYTTYLALVSVLIYTVLIIIPESRSSLSIYFFDRLIKRVETMPTVGYRLYIIWRLFTELIPVLLVVMITYLIDLRRKEETLSFKLTKEFTLMLSIGLSGSLPLTLTMVQKGWYLVPSLPYFAIAFSVLIVPKISKLVNYIYRNRPGRNFLVYFSVTIFISVFLGTIFQAGKIGREKEVLADVYKIGEIVPKFSTITVPKEMYDQYDFVLQGYLVRYFNISISPYKQYDYFLKEKSLFSKTPNGYKKMNIDLTKYELFYNTNIPYSSNCVRSDKINRPPCDEVLCPSDQLHLPLKIENIFRVNNNKIWKDI